MEDPLPTAPEKPRVGAAKSASPSSAERLAAVVARESGAAKAAAAGEKLAERRARVTLDERMASLATALRRARVENAEQASAVSDLRAAEVARLEILADALAPVVAQAPADVDIFDIAISPGERPRLFIDQIGFIEMDRDRRTYRFAQDTRHGRVMLCESADVDAIVDAATTYMAHRLIEREKALAADYASGGAAQALKAKIAAARREANAAAPRQAESLDGPLGGKAFRVFLYFIEFLGSAAFFGLLLAIAFWAYYAYLAK